jgi:hypothetical protein
MSEAKLVIGIASACSIASIMAILVVIPQLYTQMNDVNARVMDGVQAFRVNTDSAWTSLVIATKYELFQFNCCANYADGSPNQRHASIPAP